MADPQPPRLLDAVRQAIRARHLSPRTEEAYVHWIRRFIVHHGKRHPRELGASEVTHFLTDLAVRQRVSASTSNQALSALLFLYRHVVVKDLGRLEDLPRGRPPDRLPVVLTRDEVRRVLGRLTGVVWLVVALLYGAGLRITECLELRVKDVDFDRLQVTSCQSISSLCVAGMPPIWRPASAPPFCRARSIASTRTRRGTGAGSSSFPPRVCVAIPATDRRPATTCTSR